MSPLVHAPMSEKELAHREKELAQPSKTASSFSQSQAHLGSQVVPVDPASKSTVLKLASNEGRFPCQGVDLQNMQELEVEELIVRRNEGQTREISLPNQEVDQVVHSSGRATPVSSASPELDLVALAEKLTLTPQAFAATRDMALDASFVMLELTNRPSVDIYGVERKTADEATFSANITACKADLRAVLDRADFNGDERTPVVLSFPVEIRGKDGAIIKREDHSVVLRREKDGKIAILDPNKKAFHIALKEYLLDVDVPRDNIVSYELGYGVQSNDHRKLFEAVKAESKKASTEFHPPFVRHNSGVEDRNCYAVAISIARSITGYPGDGIPEDMIRDVKEALELPRKGAFKAMLKNLSTEGQLFINKASNMDMRRIAATTSRPSASGSST